MPAATFPLDATLRESPVLTGDGTTRTFGPFGFKIFTAADVAIWRKDAGEAKFTKRTGVTITRTAGEWSTFTITFATAPPLTSKFYVQGARQQSRDMAVRKANGVDTDAIDKQLTQIGVPQLEQGRELDRAAKADRGITPPVFTEALDDTRLLMAGPQQTIKNGPSLASLGAALGDATAFAALLAALQAQMAALAARIRDILDLEPATPADLDGVYIAGQIEGEEDPKKYLLTDIQAIFAARLPWDGATRFTHGPGLNMGHPLGFWRYSILDPDLAWETPAEMLASWQDYYLPRRASHIEAKADVIRIAIDPHKMLLTDGSDEALAPWVTAYKKVIDTVVNGTDGGTFKAIVDMHIPAGGDTDPATSDAGIMASYEGDKVLWRKFKAVLNALMKMMNVSFRSDQVAFEIYNETERPTGDATYQAAIVEAANELHRKFGDRIKVIVAPAFFASHASFTAATSFRRDLFHAQHIGFALHGGYYPNVFTHQGIGANFIQYVHRLPFYPTAGAKAAYVAAAVAEATGDGASSSDISTLTAQLNNYFDTFQEGTDFDGASTIPTAYPISYIWGNYLGTDEGGYILAWMNENSVSGDMMHCTEIGVHRDYEGIGAAVDDAATFFRLIRTYAVDARKMNGLVAWCEEDRHFSLREDINDGVGEYLPEGPFEKKIIRALGMYSPFSTDELGERFVYFGVNNAAIEALSASEERRGIFVKIKVSVANSIRTILGASDLGGAQLAVVDDKKLVVERQGIARQAGTNIAIPVNRPTVVGVVMDPDDVYRFAIGRPLSGGFEQYDDADKDAFTPATTMVVGQKGDGTQPFIGEILSPYLITDGALTDEEIGQIVEWLDVNY